MRWVRDAASMIGLLFGVALGGVLGSALAMSVGGSPKRKNLQEILDDEDAEIAAYKLRHQGAPADSLNRPSPTPSIQDD
jgi:hypothetical protein